MRLFFPLCHFSPAIVVCRKNYGYLSNSCHMNSGKTNSLVMSPPVVNGHIYVSVQILFVLQLALLAARQFLVCISLELVCRFLSNLQR